MHVGTNKAWVLSMGTELALPLRTCPRMSRALSWTTIVLQLYMYYVSFPLSQKVVLRGSTIFVRFNVPPLFIVPPPREREHVPCSCTQGSVPPFLDW